MNDNNEQIHSVLKEFRYYKGLAESALVQVDDDALFWRAGEHCNSIAILVGHLTGNMRSRWTDFLTEDGEKVWRERDKEFEPVINSRQELMTYWTAGWHALFRALEGLTDDQLSDIVYIRNEGHTVHEAIDRQLAHYAYHIGQIVFICKMMTPQNWKSLTIPKGGSETFNAKKFNTGPRRGHYTDEVQDS